MRSRAFSQVELLVAVAILAVGILAIFGSIAYGLQAAEGMDRLSEAVSLNRQLIGLVRTRLDPAQLPPEFSDGRRRALEAAPFAGATFSSAEPGRYQRSITVTRLDPDPNSYRHDLWKIQVGVYWNERGRPRELLLESLYH